MENDNHGDSNHGDSNHSVWHAGEIAWQKQLGVAGQMAEFGARAMRDAMPDQHRTFFAQLPFILAGYEHDNGQVWASLLSGPPGFISSPDPRHLRIDIIPAAADPRATALKPGLPLGLLGIELPTRRRNRLNGRVAQQDATGFVLAVEQSYGNCPKYIEKRNYGPHRPPAPVTSTAIQGLDVKSRRLIGNAGTFFVASTAGHGALPDISHRGGRRGFVAIGAEGTLTIPDYAGNHFFNTLGNFLLDPRAGLLFPDFESGEMLQLTGRATIIADAPGKLTLPGAERYWQFNAEAGQWLRNALPIGFTPGEVSSFSP
jgi:predicted pyridoxine 5'-phosphate oxidase superfamily flavin-nucleotide-binding protein